MDWVHRVETPGSNIVSYRLLDGPDDNPPLPEPDETAELDDVFAARPPERPAAPLPAEDPAADALEQAGSDENAVALQRAVEAMKTVRNKAGRLKALRAWLGVGRRALA